MGSSSPLGLALCAWRDTPVRESIAMASALGYRAVQLDATHPDARPRDLDRSARRDLAALLRRHELELTGIDLWLPPEHLAEVVHVERAADAVVGAMGFIRELAGLVSTQPVVSLTLPEAPDQHALAAIHAAAEREGVAIANHAWPASEEGALGLDPALAIMAGASPAKLATTLGPRLSAARLSDAGVAGRVPVDAPTGRLDVSAYAAALSISAPSAPVVADCRQLADPRSAAIDALKAWTEALAFPGS
jgi:sugar phosphate isomerase/epimerase